jgi:hypothetical protein
MMRPWVYVLSQNRLAGVSGDPFAGGGKKLIFNKGF